MVLPQAPTPSKSTFNSYAYGKNTVYHQRHLVWKLGDSPKAFDALKEYEQALKNKK